MSTPTSTARPALRERTDQSFKARSANALRNLRDALHLSPEMSDAAVLTTALAEVVAEECQSGLNPRLADAVRERYRELDALRLTSTQSRRKLQTLPPLVPLKRADGDYDARVHIDPWAPPDPVAIIRIYGKDQLGRVLQDYMLDSLKQTVAKIQLEHPGTKPTSKARKDAVIEYIVKYSGM